MLFCIQHMPYFTSNHCELPTFAPFPGMKYEPSGNRLGGTVKIQTGAMTEIILRGN